MEERVDPEMVIRDAEAAGLVLRSRETFLKYQYMLVFEKPRSMIAVSRPFFADYQTLVNAELDRLVTGRRHAGVALDGVHGPRALEAGPPGPDAARGRAVRRRASACDCRCGGRWNSSTRRR